MNKIEKDFAILSQLAPVTKDIIRKIDDVPSIEKIILAKILLNQIAVELNLKISLEVNGEDGRILNQEYPIAEGWDT